jgi:hypothetical protein
MAHICSDAGAFYTRWSVEVITQPHRIGTLTQRVKDPSQLIDQFGSSPAAGSPFTLVGELSTDTFHSATGDVMITTNVTEVCAEHDVPEIAVQAAFDNT